MTQIIIKSEKDKLKPAFKFYLSSLLLHEENDD